jgi:GH18 family chitinase
MITPLSKICIAISFLMIFFAAPIIVQAADKEVVAYFPEWTVHLHQPYYVKDMASSNSAEKLTVLNYSFVIPAPGTNGDVVCQLDDPDAAYQMEYGSALSVDGTADSDRTNYHQDLRGHFNQLLKLKAINPDLRILVALGGWTGSTWFSDAARTQQSRETFVASCIDMFIRGNLPLDNNAGGPGAASGIFDGFDIDWEYPIAGGDSGVHHSSNDDVNLTALLAEFRRQLDVIDTNLLLTIATPASAFRGDNYQIIEDKKHVNWFNLMTYDFHGGWENKTGHLTNILQSVDDPSSDTFKLSLDSTVRLYTETYKVPYSKLVAGATFYGRGWKNVSLSNDGLYQSGREAPGIDEDGYNYYKALAPLMDAGYSMYWDASALASWLYNPDEGIFWSMDEPQSLALKQRYAEAYGLKGVMTWEITGDDDQGTLLSALVSGYPAEPYSPVSALDPDRNLSINIDDPIDCAITLEGFNVVINASASAPAGPEIQQVEFFQGGESLGFDNREPWSWAWFNLPKGKHELTAEMTLSDGNWNLSESVTIDVRGEGPDLGLWQTGVSYQIGDQVFYMGCIYSAKRNHVGSRVRTPSSGRYWSQVTCGGGDCGGGGTPGNQAPIVNITSPANDSVLPGGQDINIIVTVSDPDDGLDSVGFSPVSKIPCSLEHEAGTDTYSCTWSGTPAGAHQLTVIAIDYAGVATEDSVNFSVFVEGVCTERLWDSNKTYSKGDEVTTEESGIRWRSKRTHTGVEPGTSPSKWSNLGPCVN